MPRGPFSRTHRRDDIYPFVFTQVAKNRHQINLMGRPPVTWGRDKSSCAHSQETHAHRLTLVKVHFCLCITSSHNAPQMMPASGIILKPNVSSNLDEFFPTASAALLFLCFHSQSGKRALRWPRCLTTDFQFQFQLVNEWDLQYLCLSLTVVILVWVFLWASRVKL